MARLWMARPEEQETDPAAGSDTPIIAALRTLSGSSDTNHRSEESA